MKTVCLPLLLLALTACTAVPNPDRLAWADGARPLPELDSPDAELQSTPVEAEAPAEPTPSPAPRQAASPRPSRIWVYIGGRSLNDDFDPVEDHGAFGVEYSYEPVDSLLGFEFGFMGSYGDELIYSAATGELYAGVKKTFRRESTFQPHVGAGLSAINATVEVVGLDADDTSLGGYVHGGGTWRIGRTFHLGLDLRGLFGTDLTIAGFDTDADYFQAALVLGWLF